MGAVLNWDGLEFRLIALPVVLRHSNRNKAADPGNHHIVQAAAGAVDNQQIPVFVSTSHNANVFILRIKYQIAGLGFAPGNVGTIGMLGIGAAAVAWAEDLGIAKGMTATTFQPEGAVTRQQAATFLYRYPST